MPSRFSVLTLSMRGSLFQPKRGSRFEVRTKNEEVAGRPRLLCFFLRTSTSSLRALVYASYIYPIVCAFVALSSLGLPPVPTSQPYLSSLLRFAVAGRLLHP